MVIHLRNNEGYVNASEKKLKTQMFLWFAVIFAVLMVVVTMFQYSRERTFRITQLNSHMESYADIIYNYLQSDDSTVYHMDKIIALIPDTNLRVTLVNNAGKVIYDNRLDLNNPIENHLTRPEIKALKLYETGRNIRVSKSNGHKYYYLAKKYPKLYVRVALPYEVSLVRSLKANKYFLYIMGLILFGVLVMFYWVAKYFSQTVQAKQDKLKHELTQNISHELKTPVASILGYLESIENNDSISPEKQKFFIEKSYHQALRLRSLLQDISMLNKLDDSREMYEKRPCDLAEVINEAINDLRLITEERRCHIICRFPGEIPISGNRSLLYSIFQNLIQNAVTYAGEGCTITIQMEKDDSRYYYFKFVDNGVGVPEKHLSRLFERFYRVDKGRSRKLGGTGLGLSIVKNSVLLHNGKISVKNVPTGGLQFNFSLRKV